MPASTAGNKRAIFRQVCELIPPHLVPKLARRHGDPVAGYHADEPHREHAVCSVYARD